MVESPRGSELRDSRDLYADGVNLLIGPFGFVLDFTLSVVPDPIGLETNETPQLLARIRMSPQLALALRDILNGNLSLYTEQIGPLGIPNSVLTKVTPGDNIERESDNTDA